MDKLNGQWRAFADVNQVSETVLKARAKKVSFLTRYLTARKTAANNSFGVDEVAHEAHN